MKARDLVGTGSLIRLALRRDRIKLSAWLLGISGFVWIATGVNAAFSPEEMVAIVLLATENPAMRFLVSPIRADSVTEVSRFVFLRFSFVFSLLTALMSIQAVTRHTRWSEEAGCAEMIGASVTGRYAGLASAMAVGLGANVVLALLIGAALGAHGLPVAGSLAAGASFGGLGIAFTGIAAVAVQLSGTSSGANGIGGMAFGATFALTGMANAMGRSHAGGLGFESAGLAWISPMSWTQRFYPFDDANWWILALFLLFFIVCAVLSVDLVARRDVGRGVLADRRGRPRASVWLCCPLGVAWRLQRGSLFSWAFPMVFMGLMLGASAESLGETMGATEAFGGAFSQAIAEFPFLVIGVAASGVAIYAMKAVLRMRREEDGGPLETVLSTPVKRATFVTSHVACGLAGSFVLVQLFALAQAAAMRGAGTPLAEFLVAAAYQSVGVLVLVGFVLALYGLLPGASGPVSLVVVLAAIATGPFFGTALDLPEWLTNLSPFSHIAFMPGEVRGLTILLLASVGAALGFAGYVGFSRRNVPA